MPLLEALRLHAISRTLFPQTTLKAAIRRLGFVQADPIRSPARAQDLILRHRVKGYRAGDLERRYASLDIEEDVLYAYGFMPRTTWELLHPRKSAGMSALERKVLNIVREYGALHPRELEKHFGNARVINPWGGYSKATTQALDHLHYRGLLRIARRDNGIRVYEVAPMPRAELSPPERLRKLIVILAEILAPVLESTLYANAARFRNLGEPRTAVRELLKSGELEKGVVDGRSYIYPPFINDRGEAPEGVRFLAPFDPLVWDRQRFEHLWGWRYRFEAYTPATKRLRGYYAMPLLWRDAVVGWVNARLESTQLKIEAGFAETRPRDPNFQLELAAEIAGMENFLLL